MKQRSFTRISRTAFLLSLIFFACFTAARGQTVTVFVECVEHNPSTNILTAHFGYNNVTTAAITVPYGGNNFFLQSPNFRGQPTVFQPGVNRFAYSTTLDLNGADKELVWILNRAATATATNNISNYCSRPITYQGRLSDGGNPTPTGQYDLQFELFDRITGGTALATIALEDVQVTSGVFTVQLNFLPDMFIKNNGRYLQIGVRPGTGTGTYATLNPRQELTAAPYAVASGTAVDARKLGGFDAKSYVRQNASGDVAVVRSDTFPTTGGDLSVAGNLTVTGTITGNFTVPAGSGNYIQNTTTQQATSNFNISGNGTIGGNLIVNGNLSTACRSGFTAFEGGRLCVSAMQTAATFYGANGAVQTCTNMQARVGNSADAMLTFSQSAFNYFGGLTQGWLADHVGDNTWGTWLATSPTPDFDGAPLNVYTGGSGGTAPSLPYRCVY